MTLKIGINGFGRIGRAFFRNNLKKQRFDIVAINDINPDNNNIAYLLKYDSTYGRLQNDITADEKNLYIDGKNIKIFHTQEISGVRWEDEKVDIVVDSSGVYDNLQSAVKLKQQGVKYCVVTNSPREEDIDISVIMGVNETDIKPDKHYLISSSICDANAFVPVVNVLEKEFGIEHGFLTTLHPWLGYQNLLDGPSISYATPGKIHDYYALGRASVNSLIPKTTSAISASCKVLKSLNDKFECMSFRIPTTIVSASDMSVKLNKKTDTQTIKKLFMNEAKKQKFNVFYNSNEGVVSADFTGSEFSSIIDHRWIVVNERNYLKMVLWYDNEWGYSARVVDLVDYLGKL